MSFYVCFQKMILTTSLVLARLSGHPAGPVLGWVARVEYPVPTLHLPVCLVWIPRIVLMAPHRPSDET